MARNLQKELYNGMVKTDLNIRESSHSKVDRIKLEINKLEAQIKTGDSSQETRNRLNELEELLKVEESLAYDPD